MSWHYIQRNVFVFWNTLKWPSSRNILYVRPIMNLLFYRLLLSYKFNSSLSQNWTFFSNMHFHWFVKITLTDCFCPLKCTDYSVLSLSQTAEVGQSAKTQCKPNCHVMTRQTRKRKGTWAWEKVEQLFVYILWTHLCEHSFRPNQLFTFETSLSRDPIILTQKQNSAPSILEPDVGVYLYHPPTFWYIWQTCDTNEVFVS